MKLRAPAMHDWSLPRVDLLERLDAGLHGRLTVVAAPAGFGKTSLVESWTRRLQDSSVGWLSLDERDNDPIRFWSYMVECLRHVGAQLDDRIVAELWDDLSSVEELVASSVNALAALDGRHVVVLDDLHHMSQEDVLGPLFRFVEAVPPSTTVVATTRAVPSWPLERLRARGEVDVIETGDLSFDREETAIVLEKTAVGVLLDDAEIDLLQSRSEGWPVAVQLAAHGLRRQSCPHQLVAEFGGTDGVVTGYLLEEVLSGLRPALHRFLLDVSVLDRFSVDLARAVVRGPANELVAELLAEHLFVVSIDERGEWYRLHQLIRDLLLADLASSDPARVRVLHRRAAAWYVEQNNIGTAVEHLIAAGRFDHTVELIERVHDQYHLTGGTDSVIEWLRLLPVEELEQRPRAASLLAKMLVAQGWFDEARGWIDLASRSSTTDSQKLDVIIARLRLQRALGQATEVLETFAELDALVEVATDPEARGAARAEQANSLGIRAMCHEFLGQTVQYRAALAELDHRRAELGHAAAFTVDPTLARAYAEDGELQLAASHAQLAVQRADRQGVDFYTLTYANLALAQVAWCRGQLDEAEAALRIAAQLDHGAAVWIRTLRAIRAAEILASIGRYEQVDDILESAWEGTPGARTPAASRRLIAGWGLATNATHHRHDHAYSWLAELDRLDTSGQLPHALWAHAELLRGNANLLITRFAPNGVRLPQEPLPRLRCGLALCTALHGVGRVDEAAALIGPLLASAEQHELVQPVVECSMVGSFLDATGPNGPSQRFIDLVRSPDHRTIMPDLVTKLPEPISPRELDLIRLLPTRLTNQEIASQLYVSLNTVKTHLRNIYRKLGVTSRDGAIARCHELNLL